MSQGFQWHASVCELFGVFLGELSVRKAVQYLRKQNVYVRSGFVHRDARLQTSQDIKRFGEIFLTAIPTRRERPQHRKGRPCIGSLANFGAEKLRWRDADDGEDSLSQFQFVVEDVRLTAE